MSKWPIVLLAAALAACVSQPETDHTQSPAAVPRVAPRSTAPQQVTSSPQPPPPASMPDGISYSGGDGSSIETAVIVNGATTMRLSTRAEYAYLRNRFPGFRRREQTLVRSGSRYYDALHFDLPHGDGPKTVYFDVTDTIGKR